VTEKIVTSGRRDHPRGSGLETQRPRRRLATRVAVLVATAGAGLAPGAVLASTGPAEVVPAAPITPESWWLIPVAFVITVVGAIVVAIAKPSTRRRIGAAAVFVAFGLVGTFFVLGGFFSDFSGQHRIAWPLVSIGAVIGVAGVFAAASVAGRFSKGADRS
jgi:hypothetical protein